MPFFSGSSKLEPRISCFRAAGPAYVKFAPRAENHEFHAFDLHLRALTCAPNPRNRTNPRNSCKSTKFVQIHEIHANPRNSYNFALSICSGLPATTHEIHGPLLAQRTTNFMLPFRPEGYEFRAFELLRLLRWKHANELKIA